MSMMCRQRNRGFSMMELMLALLLVGVLTGIAVPVYQSYRERTREHAAAQEIATMGVELQRYAQERRVLPESLEDTNLAGRLDPWGRPYLYYNVESNGRGGARKD